MDVKINRTFAGRKLAVTEIELNSRALDKRRRLGRVFFDSVSFARAKEMNARPGEGQSKNTNERHAPARRKRKGGSIKSRLKSTTIFGGEN